MLFISRRRASFFYCTVVPHFSLACSLVTLLSVTDCTSFAQSDILDRGHKITQAELSPTAAERVAQIEPLDYSYPEGDFRRYGAKGDGVADDTDAIQQALKLGMGYGHANDVYRITRSLPLASHLQIDGNGCVFLVDADVAPFANATGRLVLYMHLQEMTIRANRTIDAAALELTDVCRSSFENILIDGNGPNMYFAYGIRLDASASLSLWNGFSSIQITAVSKAGCWLDGSANDNFFFHLSLNNQDSGQPLPAGLVIANGTNNKFFGLTLEAVWKNPGDNAYCILLGEDAYQNGIFGVRTEGHPGTESAFGVLWNGDKANQIYGHHSLGVGSYQGAIGTNTWIASTPINGAEAEFVGGTQLQIPLSDSGPAVHPGSIAYDEAERRFTGFADRQKVFVTSPAVSDISIGTASFENSVTAIVTFPERRATGEYRVFLSPKSGNAYWIDEKTSTGFIVRTHQACNETIDWMIVE